MGYALTLMSSIAPDRDLVSGASSSTTSCVPFSLTAIFLSFVNCELTSLHVSRGICHSLALCVAGSVGGAGAGVGRSRNVRMRPVLWYPVPRAHEKDVRAEGHFGYIMVSSTFWLSRELGLTLHSHSLRTLCVPRAAVRLIEIPLLAL